MSNDGLFMWRGLRVAICTLLAIYLIAPLLIVVIISFSSAQFLAFPPPGFSLQWYVNLFTDPDWTSSLIVSIEIMIPSSLLATILGTAAAYGLVRGQVPGASIIIGVLMAPIVVPSILVAAALYGVYSHLGLNGTFAGLIAGHTILCLPYVVATVSAALKTIDFRLEDAAATMGAAPWYAFRRVTLPLLAPAVLSGVLFAMMTSFDEFIVSLFVSSARLRPVAVQMWSNIRGDFDPTAAAIGTLCFALALFVIAAESLMRRRPIGK